jgi:excinuclease UvrABC nuclease subunit
MKVCELIPCPNQKVFFNLSSFREVPKLKGCYILSNSEDDILYVGLSTNLLKRFENHLDNPEKTRQTTIGKVIWFHYLVHDTNNLEELERTWINQYCSIHGVLPALNKIYSPVS